MNCIKHIGEKYLTLNNFLICYDIFVSRTAKTTLPKRHFAETTLCRMRHFAEILPKFGKNAEKDVLKSISYNVIFS